MTDTTEVTSDERTCTKCESPFGGQDDKRFKQCAKCRGAVTVKETAEAHPTVATFPDTIPSHGAEPVPIKLEEDAHAFEPPPPREFYWCGTTKDSPIFNITLGGISFPKHKGEVRDGDVSGRKVALDNVADGMIHQLTEAHVKLILEHAKNKVIRNFRKDVLGNDPNDEKQVVFLGDIISKSGSRTRPFVPQEKDIPIGCFVYMVKVRNKTDRYTDKPPTMVERNW